MSDQNIDDLDPRTLEILYEQIRSSPEDQVELADQADTRTFQIFTAATVVTGLAGLSSSKDVIGTPAAVVLGCALVLYVSTGMLLFLQTRARTMQILAPDTVWEHLWHADPDQVRHTIIATSVRAYRFNNQVLARKGRFAQAALTTTTLQVVFMGLALGLRLFN